LWLSVHYNSKESENNSKCYHYTGISNGKYKQDKSYLSNGVSWKAFTDLPHFEIVASLPV
jgi:hypothetical protein